MPLSASGFGAPAEEPAPTEQKKGREKRPEVDGANAACDGQMRTDGNLGRTLTFNPNSDGLWDNQPDFAELPMRVDGDGEHWDHRVDDDHWEQPGDLFRLMTPAQQQTLFENTARAMGDARLHIQERHIANCAKADPAYGAGVARALGIESRLAAE